MDKKAVRELNKLGFTAGRIFTTHRRAKPNRPEWATSRERVEAVVLAPARARARLAYLYWVLGYTAQEAATETGVALCTAKKQLQGMAKLGG